MSTTLYRKYRPRKFSDIIGQQHIIKTLSGAISTNHIGHAYLFTGPRGTGKTTLARIFAKSISCLERKEIEACEKCLSCQNISSGQSMDIFEIDAASNTGVENIRELREKVRLSPTVGKYKVYIIDEVHMLSSGAFNALLKTLEEPPAHVVFILATTEIHKVPETIISRCQRFDFTHLPINNIIQKLSNIAESEKVKIEKDALEIIALAAEGGMRDAESLLAQIISLEDKNITTKEVEEILGTASHKDIEKMAALLIREKTSDSFLLLNELSKNGIDLEVFAKALINYFRQLLVLSINPHISEITSIFTKEKAENISALASETKSENIISSIEILLEAQSRIKTSFLPQLPLEIAFVKISFTKNAAPLSPTAATPEQSFSQKKAGINIPPAPTPRAEPEKAEVIQPKKPVIAQEDIISLEMKKDTPLVKATEESATQEGESISLPQVKTAWNQFLSEIRKFNHSLSAFLSNCEAVKTEGNTIIIATAYPFYKEKFNEPQNRLTIKEVFDKILKVDCRINIATEEEAGIKISQKIKNAGSSRQESQPSETASLLDDAAEMFGAKVVGEE